MSENKKRKLEDNSKEENSTITRFEVLEKTVKQQGATIKGLEEFTKQQSSTITGLEKLVKKQDATIKLLSKDVNELKNGFGFDFDFGYFDQDYGIVTPDHVKVKSTNPLDIEMLLSNPAYECIAKLMFSYFDYDTMATCCLVSKTLMTSVVKQRHWWDLQLDLIRTKSRFTYNFDPRSNMNGGRNRKITDLLPWYTKFYDNIQKRFSNEDHRNMIRSLKQYWKDVWVMEPKMSPFLYFITDEDLLRCFLRVFDKEDVRSEDNVAIERFRTTPFAYACQHGRPQIVSILIDSDSEKDFNTTYGFPLHVACQKGRLEIVKLLFDRRHEISLDLNRVDQEGKTAIEVAKMNNHHNIAMVLESYEFV